MTYKRTLAKITVGLLLAAGSTLGAAGAAGSAQAGDTGWNGTKIIKERPGQIKAQGDTGWNGT